MAESIKIEELRIRVPGLSREEALSLGKDVSRRLLRAFPAGMQPRTFGALDTYVTAPRAAADGELALVIASKILEGFQP